MYRVPAQLVDAAGVVSERTVPSETEWVIEKAQKRAREAKVKIETPMWRILRYVADIRSHFADDMVDEVLFSGTMDDTYARIAALNELPVEAHRIIIDGTAYELNMDAREIALLARAKLQKIDLPKLFARRKFELQVVAGAVDAAVGKVDMGKASELIKVPARRGETFDVYVYYGKRRDQFKHGIFALYGKASGNFTKAPDIVAIDATRAGTIRMGSGVDGPMHETTTKAREYPTSRQEHVWSRCNIWDLLEDSARIRLYQDASSLRGRPLTRRVREVAEGYYEEYKQTLTRHYDVLMALPDKAVEHLLARLASVGYDSSAAHYSISSHAAIGRFEAFLPEAQAIASRPDVVKDKVKPGLKEQSRILTEDIGCSKASYTIGVVVEDEEYARLIRQDARKLEEYIWTARDIPPDERGSIKYVVYFDDGTLSEENTGRLKAFRDELRARKEENPDEIVFTFRLWDDKREAFKGLFKESRLAHMVSLDGEWKSAWNQMLLGPLFARYIELKKKEAASGEKNDESIEASITAIVNSIKEMDAAVRADLAEKLREIKKVEDLERLFDGLSIILYLPDVAPETPSLDHLRRAEREAGAAL